ncbi:hypothetical protein [Phaffia rhodozyma]|uniref:Uncharacterized protein n=1 Tax=Phaffia rhodozyma TaxID=264483 RepID=A0A0F7SJ11_PHARH|nr:hypothetical protein [Phaffia rhodozyma]
MFAPSLLVRSIPSQVRLQTRSKATSSMGIARKAVISGQNAARPTKKSKKAKADRPDVLIDYKSEEPVFKGGVLSTKSLSSLVNLYHSTQHHITKDNLDAVIDAEFAPIDGQPRNRPLMASLIDLHVEMRHPGKLSRPSPTSSLSPDASSSLSSSSASSLVSPAAPNYADFGADAVVLPKDLEAVEQQRLANARKNDWIGSDAGDLTPRMRMVVEALHGAEEGRRPGLELALENRNRIQHEREQALKGYQAEK